MQSLPKSSQKINLLIEVMAPSGLELITLKTLAYVETVINDVKTHLCYAESLW